MFTLCLPALGLNLATQEWAPYQMKNQGEAQGIAIDAIRCVEKNLGEQIQITFLPWKRAQQATESGEYDGFFAASQSDYRDKFAEFGEPFIPQRWRFYYSRDEFANPPLIDQIRQRYLVGVRQTSNLAYILTQEGFRLEKSVDDLPTLIKMLKMKRVQFIAENDQVYAFTNDTWLASIFYRRHDLGVYIGKKYLARHPGFMKKLNQASKKCIIEEP